MVIFTQFNPPEGSSVAQVQEKLGSHILLSERPLHLLITADFSPLN